MPLPVAVAALRLQREKRDVENREAFFCKKQEQFQNETLVDKEMNHASDAPAFQEKNAPTRRRPYQLSPKTPRPSFVYGEPPFYSRDPQGDEIKSREDDPTEPQRESKQPHKSAHLPSYNSRAY